MEKMILSFLKHKISVLMVFAAIVLFGTICFGGMKIDYLPELDVPRLSVAASYPGLPPAEVRQLVTIPLENALSSLKGLKSIKSVSRDGLSLIDLKFHWGQNMTTASVEAREIIDTAYAELPTEMSKPVVIPAAAGEYPVITLAITPKTATITEAKKLASKEIRSRLQRMSSAGQIILAGGLTEEVHVILDQEKAFRLGLDYQTISTILSSNHVNAPGGSFEQGRTQYIVKTEGEYKSIQDIENQMILLKDTPAFALKEIAQIKMATSERMSYTGVNGAETVFLYIYRRPGCSPVDLSAEMKKALADLQLSWGQSLDFTVIDDSSVMIALSLSDLVISAILGTLIAFLVLWIFLKNVRSAVIVTFSIPMSILLCGILMRAFGVTLNTMSLGGLALGIGMLVDNAVVMIEALIARGNRDLDSQARAAASIFPSLAGSTITSIVVFLPVLFLPGIVGKLFSDLAFTVCFSLISSLFVSLLLVPVLFLLFKVPQKDGKTPAMSKIYGRLTDKLLKKRIFIVLTTLGICASTLLLLPFIKTEFMPNLESSRLNCNITFPAGTDINYSMKSVFSLCNQFKELPFVESVYTRGGGELSDTVYLTDPAQSSRTCSITIVLKKNKGSAQATKSIEDKMKSLDPEIEWNIRKPEKILTPLLGMRGGEDRILVTAENPDDALLAAIHHQTELQKIVSQKPQLSPTGKKKEISLIPDRVLISSIGLTPKSLTELVRQGLSGTEAISLDMDGKEYAVKIMADKSMYKSLEDLQLFPVPTTSGNLRPLGSISKIIEKESVPLLLRENRKDVCALTVQTQAETVKKVNQYIAENSDLMSDSTSVLAENFQSIILMLCLSLALLFLVMGAQFQSFVIPLIVMLSIPLCAIGIFPIWFLTGTTLNFSSLLGILVLLGITVNNGILLFENYTTSDVHLPSASEIRDASVNRLKPILMTALSTVTAMIPVAINLGGTNSQAPLAVTVIGGLTASTFLALLFFPPVFSLYFQIKSRKKT